MNIHVFLSGLKKYFKGNCVSTVSLKHVKELLFNFSVLYFSKSTITSKMAFNLRTINIFSC